MAEEEESRESIRKRIETEIHPYAEEEADYFGVPEPAPASAPASRPRRRWPLRQRHEDKDVTDQWEEMKGD